MWRLAPVVGQLARSACSAAYGVVQLTLVTNQPLKPARLIVMRHGKAEPFASTDHERTLTARGVRDARDAGAHLGERGLVPDWALVSSAVRARQTWEAVCEGLGSQPETSFEDAVFTGSADVVLSCLAEAPARATTVMFVGHNPAASYLCHELDDGQSDPVAVSGLLQGFPPAAVCVLEVAVPWDELGAETGRVVDYYVGGS
jgi:phosphohistidine phosphatase